MDLLLDSCGLLRLRCLLLICFCVFGAAAECPNVLVWENIVLSDEALLLNHFVEGTSITVECVNGYERKDGSGVIKCLGGAWTEFDLTCKKKDCGLPRSQPHMSFNFSEGTLFSAVIKVICDEGYQIRGSSYKQCYSKGWSGKSSCEVVTCEKPAKVTNAKSSWVSMDNPEYGDTIEYVCNTGYTLVGENTLKCSKTGQYDAQPPECRDTSSSVDSTSPREETSTTATVPHEAPAGEEEQVTASVTSATTSLFQEKQGETVDTNRDKGHMAILVGVLTSVVIVSLVIGAFLYKFLLRRKGSANATVSVWGAGPEGS